MHKLLLKNLSLVALIALMALPACSKKKRSDEDMAGDTAAMDSAPVGQQAGAKIAELSAVYFDYDSFNLSSESKTRLNQAATWLKSNSINFQIEGHCDERGTTEYNLALGERRAAAVKTYLQSKGVDAGRMSTISYGEERPEAQGSNESAWAKNRRAEFVYQGQ